MILGYHAPLPPAPSGVADYAAAMLRGLRHFGEVRANADGERNLYHIGNNRMHAEIYARAMEKPGLVILHDALLQHLFLGMYEEAEYIEEFVYNYGEWNRGLANTLWRRRAGAMADPRYFRFPMLRRLAERSLALVVHSEQARASVLAHHPAAKVAVIPHLALESTEEALFDSLDGSARRERFRRESLGLQPGEQLLGIYGYLRESKRLHAVLRVLRRLRGEGRPVRLLVAGSFASDDYARAMAPLLRAEEGVLLRGPSAAAAFLMLLQAADICLNLRYPPAGESSGIAARAMPLGVPLVASEGMGGFPPGTCAPVAGGPCEEASLADTLRWLLDNPASRQALARAAWQYAKRHMEPLAVCRAVWRLAIHVAPNRTGQVPARVS